MVDAGPVKGKHLNQKVTGGPEFGLSRFALRGFLFAFIRILLLFGPGGVFLFSGRFSSLREFHGPGKQAGEKSPAQECAEEKLPGLWIAGSSLGESDQPTRESFGVLRVMKWVEEPGRSVGEQVKQNRTKHSATNQLP